VTASYSEVLQLQKNIGEAVLHCICALMSIDTYVMTTRQTLHSESLIGTEAVETETDDNAIPRLAVKRLSLSSKKSSSSQNTSGSNSISNSEDVFGIVVSGSVNVAVNVMLHDVWTRLFYRSSSLEQKDEKDSLSLLQPSRTASQGLSMPDSYSHIDIDSWLHPRNKDLHVVRMAATCLHRLR
jgi:hypothetical protein